MTLSDIQLALSQNKLVLISGSGFEKGTQVKSFTVGNGLISIETGNVRTFRANALEGLLNKVIVL